MSKPTTEDKKKAKLLEEVKNKMSKPAVYAGKNPNLSRCLGVKDQNLCNRLTIAKVKDYADTCGVKTKDVNQKARDKAEICQELAIVYQKWEFEDQQVTQSLRTELNRVYFNMFFVDKASQAGMIRKFFFGESIAKLDKKKKDFIDLYTAVYNDIDFAVDAENRYNLIDSLYNYGQAIEKMLLLIELDREIKVEKKYQLARQDLINQLSRMIHEYTIKIVQLTGLLKHGGQSPSYFKYLEDHEFDLQSFHEFTLYGNDVFGKVASVYDGDTFTVVLQVNNNFYKWNIRTFGYDAYEMKSSEPQQKERAIAGKTIISDLILNKIIMIRALPSADKYGRILANIYMFTKDVPVNFDYRPRYATIATGLDESKQNKVENIPVGNFKNLLKEYFLPDRLDLIYINQLMLDLGVGIPYFGGTKTL